MGAVFSADQIIEIAGGRLAVGMMPDVSASISLDTRTNVEDSWFLALRGANFDGHDFIGAAFSGGAVGCIVEERQSYPIAGTSFPLIAVGDTLSAYAELSRHWRLACRFKVVFVLSEHPDQSLMIGRLAEKALSRQKLTDIIELNHEGSAGCVNRLLRQSEDVDFVIVNMVAADLDQIELVATALQPDMAVIVGRPFNYLRITHSEAEIVAASNNLFGCISRHNGQLAWAAEPSLLSVYDQLPVGHTFVYVPPEDEIQERPEDEQDFSPRPAEQKGERLFLIDAPKFDVPSQFGDKSAEIWCVDWLCRQAGVSPEGIVDLLSDPLFR